MLKIFYWNWKTKIVRGHDDKIKLFPLVRELFKNSSLVQFF